MMESSISKAGLLQRGHHGEDHDAARWLELVSSCDGHERQAAVEAMGRLRHGPGVRALLARANDWVPQVRAAARRSLCILLDDAVVGDWLKALDAVVALERARRADHRELLDAIAAFLGQARHRPALLTASASGGPSVKRHVFALLWTQADDDLARYELLRAALIGPDVVVARDALQRMESGVSSARRRALIDAACCSRFAQIRAEGLRRALAQPGGGAPSLVRAMCLDGSALVRAIAFAAVKAEGDEATVIDAAAARLARVDILDRDKVPALQFLCTVDKSNARHHCETFRQSPAAALRRAAFAGLLAAAPEVGKEALILEALADPSALVQRVAVESVRRGAAVPPASQVIEVGLVHGGGGLSRAISLLRHAPTWTRLQWLLHVWQKSVKPELKLVCVNGLEQWEIDARNSFVTPTAHERAAIRRHWQQTALALPVALARRMRVHLRIHELE
jgi:hypothetical protein